MDSTIVSSVVSGTAAIIVACIALTSKRKKAATVVAPVDWNALVVRYETLLEDERAALKDARSERDALCNKWIACRETVARIREECARCAGHHLKGH